MNATKITIQVMQAPEKICPEYMQEPILDKIKRYIVDINSNINESYQQWQYLKHMYNVVCKVKQLTPHQKSILALLEPEMVKHGQYDVEDAVELDGTTMNRFHE